MDIEREPQDRTFTRQELMLIHRALINEHLAVAFPPLTQREYEVAVSASQKIIKLICEYDDRQCEGNE
jgi:hypothetical protein